MTESMEIKGGAGEFEAAIIAVVLDRIAREESAAREVKSFRESRLSAWVRAIRPQDPKAPRENVWPD